MSEHLSSPSKLLAETSYESRHKTNEIFGLLDGPDAENAAYAAKPFMDVAVDLHDFITAPENENYTANDDLGVSELVGYAEKKARAAVGGTAELSEQEDHIIEGYCADLRARKASEAAEAATDLYDVVGTSADQRAKAFTQLVDKRLDNMMRSSEGEDRSKYFHIYESLVARRNLVDADQEDLAMFSRKYTPNSAHIDAVVDLTKHGIVSSESERELTKDIRKNNQNTETDQFLATSYRLFIAHETKNVDNERDDTGSSKASHEPELQKEYRGMTDAELKAAQDIVAGMNSKTTAERSTIIPQDPTERQAFEKEFFSNPEHIIPNEKNIKVLGELVVSYATSLAVQVREMQDRRADPGVKYPGVPHTFWFTGDFITGTDPVGGKDELLFNYVKDQVKQPHITYGLILKELPMDKIAKLMGIDLRKEVPGYDSVFSTPPRYPKLKAIYDILDSQ